MRSGSQGEAQQANMPILVMNMPILVMNMPILVMKTLALCCGTEGSIFRYIEIAYTAFTTSF